MKFQNVEQTNQNFPQFFVAFSRGCAQQIIIMFHDMYVGGNEARNTSVCLFYLCNEAGQNT
jgi:hypothetical protein